MPLQIETNCPPPLAETVSPAARVMIDICHQLGCFYVPKKNFDGTNLQGMGGRPLEELTISDLEKATLLAAGFPRPPEFTRKVVGTFEHSNEGLILCQGSSKRGFDEVINDILTPAKNIIGIRVTPASPPGKRNGTKPSRPFQKIDGPNHPGIVRDATGRISGIYQHKDPNGDYIDSCLFNHNDVVEIFIEPRADIVGNEPQAGGFIIQVQPDGTYRAFVTTGGVDIRNVHGSDTIKNGTQRQVDGRLNQRETDPVIKDFRTQSALPLQRLRNAIYSLYPNTEIQIEGLYATIGGNTITCAFDVEIPQKTAAQWQALTDKRRSLPLWGGYNETMLGPYINSIYMRFLANQRIGD